MLGDYASVDSAQPDLLCLVNGVECHPGEANARNVSSNPLVDAVGIHSNKDAFGKVIHSLSVSSAAGLPSSTINGMLTLRHII